MKTLKAASMLDRVTKEVHPTKGIVMKLGNRILTHEEYRLIYNAWIVSLSQFTNNREILAKSIHTVINQNAARTPVSKWWNPVKSQHKFGNGNRAFRRANSFMTDNWCQTCMAVGKEHYNFCPEMWG